MRYVFSLLVMLAGAPLVAQAWDVRVEVPFAEGQNLPRATVLGMGQVVDGGLDTGKGVILTLNHRLVRVNPVLRLDWTVEYSQMQADGQVRVGAPVYGSRLKQDGIGAGLNAQFWIPFTGVAGELGVIQRFQKYEFRAADSTEDTHISRTWLRVGARWRIPMPLAAPYVAVSYQQPVSKDRPAQLGSAPNMGAYLAAQGAGQEFQRMWTVGVGVQF
jgi:hypothetical protein